MNCYYPQSQQDLTLDDLEPDVLSKPPSKGRKKETDEEKVEELADNEFSLDKAGEVWNIPVLQGMEKPELMDRYIEMFSFAVPNLRSVEVHVKQHI